MATKRIFSMGEMSDFENSAIEDGVMCEDTRMLIEVCDCPNCTKERESWPDNWDKE